MELLRILYIYRLCENPSWDMRIFNCFSLINHLYDMLSYHKIFPLCFILYALIVLHWYLYSILSSFFRCVNFGLRLAVLHYGGLSFSWQKDGPSSNESPLSVKSANHICCCYFYRLYNLFYQLVCIFLGQNNTVLIYMTLEVPRSDMWLPSIFSISKFLCLAILVTLPSNLDL